MAFWQSIGTLDLILDVVVVWILPVPVFQINHEKSDWQPRPCFSWIGYTIDTYSGLICATDSRIGKLFSELVDICVALEKSRFVHVKGIASIVGQIVSLSPSCGTVTQIMTRYLQFIVNSRHSWNTSVFVHDQGMNEVLFSRDNLKALNGVLLWPVPFVPSVVVFSDASANGCAAFIQGTDLVFQRNWSLDESEKSSTWREVAAIKFSIEAFGTRLSKQGVGWHTDSQNAFSVGKFIIEIFLLPIFDSLIFISFFCLVLLFISIVSYQFSVLFGSPRCVISVFVVAFLGGKFYVRS